MSTQLTHGPVTDCGNSMHDYLAGDTLNVSTTHANLVQAYEYGGRVEGRGAHYYSKDTRRFFGTRNAHLVAGTNGGFTVELQTNAPAGCDRYQATGWKLTPSGYPVPFGGCAHGTLKAARACALATYQTLTNAR